MRNQRGSNSEVKPSKAVGESARGRLLASAERLFAEHGFDGVSMRQIAADAGAHLALIHYHFGTKRDIFRAIWVTHYDAKVQELRRGGFASIDFSAPRKTVVRDLVGLFWKPLLLTAGRPELRDFWVIGAREFVDPHEPERGILKEFLDPPALQFIQAFSRALPDLNRKEIAWGYQAMVGVFTLHVADQDRIYRLSDGEITTHRAREGIERLTEFCIGGWLSLAQSRTRKTGNATRKKPRSPSNTQPKSVP